MAIKEASGDLGLAAHMIQLCGDRLDFYSGNDDIVVPLMSIGGKGVISVAANVLPREIHQMCQLFLEGNWEEAAKMQLRYLPLINALFCEVNPIPVKTAMNMLGYGVGKLKLPLCDLSSDHKVMLQKELEAANLYQK